MQVVLLSGSALSQLLFIFDCLPPHLIHLIAFGHNKGEVIMATITDLELMSFTVWIIITAVVLYISWLWSITRTPITAKTVDDLLCIKRLYFQDI